MYAIDCEAVIEADPDALWQVWTAIASYPSWDPREDQARLDGDFAVGTTGFSKQKGRRPGAPFELIVVEPKTRWASESPLPGGKLVIDHHLEVLDDGRIKLSKRYEAHGPMQVLFRLVFAKGIRRDVPGSFAALGAEARRVAGAGTDSGPCQ